MYNFKDMRKMSGTEQLQRFRDFEWETHTVEDWKLVNIRYINSQSGIALVSMVYREAVNCKALVSFPSFRIYKSTTIESTYIYAQMRASEKSLCFVGG